MVESCASAPVFDYDVECDCISCGRVNYRCGYCFFSPEILGRKDRFMRRGTVRAAFDATGKRWLVHLTGGSPLFTRFSSRLAKR